MTEQQGNPQIRVRTSKDFRLKDNPPQRRVQFVNLKQVFGFLPEIIAIEKLEGKNNRMVVHAVLTPEEVGESNDRTTEKLMQEMKEIQEAEREVVEKNLKK